MQPLNKTPLSELMWSEDKNAFTTLRSGQQVKHLEIKGKSARGNKISMILLPDRERAWIKVLERFPLLLGVKRIRYTDGTFTDLAQEGTRTDIEKFLNECEADRGTEANRGTTQ